MNIYTHLERLEKITAHAELIKYAKEGLYSLQENKTLHQNVFGHVSDAHYDHQIDIRTKAIMRLESKYRHLVSELNQL